MVKGGFTETSSKETELPKQNCVLPESVAIDKVGATGTLTVTVIALDKTVSGNAHVAFEINLA